MTKRLKLDFSNDKSIYVQIAASVEDDILKGALAADEQVPSTNEIAVLFKINPATAAKGINLLVGDGILYKKRGVGMFVAAEAKTHILKKRRDAFARNFVAPLLDEAGRLGIGREELAGMILSGERENDSNE